MHLYSASTGGLVPSAPGMRLLTYTFVALIAPLAAATRGQPGARRALWAAALATFAVSALHLTHLHGGDASWPVELLGHHASLPLAFAILYQDYPFALADLFLKRALALLALLALAFSGILLFGQYSATFAQLDPRQVGLLVTLWVGTALLYPSLRRNIAWFVDAVVLHRPDYPSSGRWPLAGSRHTMMCRASSDVCALLGPALSARKLRGANGRLGTATNSRCRQSGTGNAGPRPDQRGPATRSRSQSPADAASCPTIWRRSRPLSSRSAHRRDPIMNSATTARSASRKSKNWRPKRARAPCAQVNPTSLQRPDDNRVSHSDGAAARWNADAAHVAARGAAV